MVEKLYAQESHLLNMAKNHLLLGTVDILRDENSSINKESLYQAIDSLYLKHENITILCSKLSHRLIGSKAVDSYNIIDNTFSIKNHKGVVMTVTGSNTIDTKDKIFILTANGYYILKF